MSQCAVAEHDPRPDSNLQSSASQEPQRHLHTRVPDEIAVGPWTVLEVLMQGFPNNITSPHVDRLAITSSATPPSIPCFQFRRPTLLWEPEHCPWNVPSSTSQPCEVHPCPQSALSSFVPSIWWLLGCLHGFYRDATTRIIPNRSFLTYSWTNNGDSRPSTTWSSDGFICGIAAPLTLSSVRTSSATRTSTCR